MQQIYQGRSLILQTNGFAQIITKNLLSRHSFAMSKDLAEWQYDFAKSWMSVQGFQSAVHPLPQLHRFPDF